MVTSKTIGENLSFLRKLNKMTQDNVSEFLGINRVELSYYENGQRNCPLNILNKLADLYRVELIDIMNMDTEDKSIHKIAFRSNDLSKGGYLALAEFGKIIKNYLKMKKIESRI